jgi:hypothetical protein
MSSISEQTNQLVAQIQRRVRAAPTVREGIDEVAAEADVPRSTVKHAVYNEIGYFVPRTFEKFQRWAERQCD